MFAPPEMQNSIWAKGAARNKTGMQKKRKKGNNHWATLPIALHEGSGWSHKNTLSITDTHKLGTMGALSLRLPVWCRATNGSTLSSAAAGQQAAQAVCAAGWVISLINVDSGTDAAREDVLFVGHCGAVTAFPPWSVHPPRRHCRTLQPHFSHQGPASKLCSS